MNLATEKEDTEPLERIMQCLAEHISSKGKTWLAYLNDCGMGPFIRLFSNRMEVKLGMEPSSGGMVPTSCTKSRMSNRADPVVHHIRLQTFLARHA